MTTTDTRYDERTVAEIERDFAVRLRQIYATKPDITPPVTAIEWDVTRRVPRRRVQHATR